jgi:hypothetical protein
VNQGQVTRTLQTQDEIEVDILDLRGAHDSAQRGTLVVLDQSESLGSLPDWAKSLVGNDAVVILAPRGVGPTTWVRKSPPNYVERAHVLLGQTVDQGRVWDVAATVRWLAEASASRIPWRVAGSRQAGIIGAYAALFEPSAAEVVLVQPATSHHEGPIFLSVLRVLDIPAALGLLAPRPLRLVGAKADAFSLTRTLYQRARAESKLDLK